MVIHEKLVLPDNLPAFAPIWAELPRQLHSFFPNYGKKRHSVCLGRTG